MPPAISTTPVNITASHVVSLADPKNLESLPLPFRLGPLDHVVHPSVLIDLVYVYERPANVNSKDFIPVSRLREAISNLLNFYPQLTGRLAIDNSNGVRSITKLGMGVPLFEASCDQPLLAFREELPSHLTEFPIDISMDHLPGTGAALIAPWDPSFDDEIGIQRGPLLLFQRTQFSCGSVAIGYRISHAVCAAEGCLHLYQDLCEIYRKLSRGDIGVLDVPPHIIPMGADRIINCDEQKRATLDPPVLFLPSCKPGEGPGGDAGEHMKSTVTSDTPQEQAPPIPIIGSYMHYTPIDLSQLKAEATCPDDSLSWVSTFEALLASIWQVTYRANARFAASKARGAPCGNPLPRSQRPTPSLRTSINVAPPSRLDLAGHNKGMGKSHYFPNAVVPVFFTIPNESDDQDGLDMWDAPLWKVARFIHRRMRERDVTHALEVIDWMCDLPDKRLANVDFNLFAGSFVISDWRQYDIYGERTALDDVEARLAGPPFTEVWAVDGFATFLKAKERGAVEDYMNGGIDVRYTVNEAAKRVMGGWLGSVGP